MTERDERRRQLLLMADRLNQAQRAMHALWQEPERRWRHWELFMDVIHRGGTGRAADRETYDLQALEFPTAEEIKATPEYERILAELNDAYGSMYSGLPGSAEQFRESGAAGVEDALAFVEADPWCHRSGYMKQDLVRYLRQVPLDEDQKHRLRAVFVGAIKAGPRWEFREYCRTARALDSPSFRRRLAGMRDDRLSGSGARKRAGWMLDAIIRTNSEGTATA